MLNVLNFVLKTCILKIKTVYFLYRLDGIENMTKAEHTKRSILEACNRLIQEEGVEACTLENVARKAEVSKGGLLYHYPNKEALIRGLIEHYLERVDCRLRNLAAQSGGDPKKTFVRFLEKAIDQDNLNAGFQRNYGIFAALERNPDLLQPIVEHEAAMLQRIKEAFPRPSAAITVKLALDGLLYRKMLGFDSLSKQDRQEVKAVLRGLLDHK